MIRHLDAGTDSHSRSKEIQKLIRRGSIKYGGNIPAKIYGRLSCASGKRMTVKNRIFFENMQEAIDSGYRPCAHCMHKEYLLWKKKQTIPKQ